MIKSLGLVNIQSHKETVIEFHHGFNVICGDSDSGKSTILRTISWIDENKPNPNILKSWFCKKNEGMAAEVTFVEQDGSEVSIIKERPKTTSSYTITKGTNKPVTLDTVARSVPEEVASLINFSELNFKGQHDPYLLKMTGGQLAKIINELVGLSAIDKTISYQNTKVDRLKSEYASTTKNIEAIEEEIEKLQYLEELGPKIDQLEKYENERQQISHKITLLNNLITDIKGTESEIEFCQSVLEVKKESQVIFDLFEKLKKTTTKRINLSKVVSNYLSAEDFLQNEKDILQLTSPCNQIQDKIKKLNDIKTKRQKIAFVINSLKKCEESHSIAKSLVVKAKKEQSKYIGSIKVCPVCKKPLDKSIQEIIRE